MKNKHEKIFN